MNSAVKLAARNTDRWVLDLMECLRIPSISTRPDYAESVAECADWIVSHLHGMGLKGVRAEKTQGHPMITGEHIVDPSLPTVLVYGHYDVQPADPLELWTSPPFEPEIRDNKVFARGAVDDKGQLFMVIKAIQACIEADGTLPVNLKFAVEGEEESGSESLLPFLKKHREALAADTVLVCDTSMMDAQTPTVTASLRGMSYMQVDLKAGGSDMHSGAFGGAVVNVLRVVGELIASFHDSDNRVAVEGFYEGAGEVTDELRAQIAEFPFDEGKWRETASGAIPNTEKGVTIAEATAARPCLDVNGIWGGYQGDGAKTVIPCEAGFKVSARLVNNMDSEAVYRRVKAHIEPRVPRGVEVKVRLLNQGSAFSVAPDSPGLRAATKALRDTFGRDPVMHRGGGSIPAVSQMKDVLGIESTLIGFGLNSDGLHAPNEHFGLDRFARGVETVIRFFHHFGAR